MATPYRALAERPPLPPEPKPPPALDEIPSGLASRIEDHEASPSTRQRIVAVVYVVIVVLAVAVFMAQFRW